MPNGGPRDMIGVTAVTSGAVARNPVVTGPERYPPAALPASVTRMIESPVPDLRPHRVTGGFEPFPSSPDQTSLIFRPAALPGDDEQHVPR